MNALMKKLAGASGTSGETLVEALVAMLVASFAMIMLAMAISVSSDIIDKGNAAADSYYAANGELVAYAAGEDSAAVGGTDGSVTITANLDGTPARTTVDGLHYVTVDVPGGTECASYRVD